MNDQDTIGPMMAKIGADARAAATVLATVGSERKHAALIGAAEAIWENRMAIMDANAEDLVYGEQKGLSPAMMDRLMLDEPRIRAMAEGLRNVAAQADPVGAVMDQWDMPSGLNIRRVR
ncbi:MAG: gamma-glutamyl-phosphate reductase, partial [Paracoccaceae bacterium]|nr:gamma-glutamyl-phosphate reductase [Paracoccaceae bacterium]